MTKKKILIIIIASVLALALIIGIIAMMVRPIPLDYSGADLDIISDGVTYDLPSRPLNAMTVSGVCADGYRLYYKEASELLANVRPIQAPFEFVIGREDIFRGVSYTIYNNLGEEVQSSGKEFVLPDKDGEYICIVEASWGNDNEYSGSQYYFKFKLD